MCVYSICIRFKKKRLKKKRSVVEWIDKTSATEMVESGSIPGGKNIIFTAFLLDVKHYTGQCEASTVSGRHVGRWQLDAKTERSLRRRLVLATW